jgi:hypothetical protein
MQLRAVWGGVLVCVVACSGSPDDPDAVSFDPEVTSTAPLLGSVDVDRASRIDATFNVDMDPATIDASTMTVSRATTPVTGAVTYDAATRTASFTPASPLARGERYDVKLSSAIKSTAQRALASDYVWSFSARDGVWSAREPIGRGSAPFIALASDGTGFAVWFDFVNAGYRVQARKYAASAWGAVDTLDNVAGHAYHPRVAINAAHDTVVVWEQDAGGTRDVWARRYTDAGGWGTAELIETSSSYAPAPNVVIAPSGDAIAAWVHSDGVWANRYVVGSGWGTAEQLVDAASGLQIAGDADGNAIVLWGGSSGLKTRRYVVGQGWAAEATLTTVATISSAITIDGTGDATAVWTNASGVHAARYTASGWSDAMRIDDASGVAGRPSVAAAGNGDVFAVWRQAEGTDNAKQNVWASRYVAGAWEAAALIETDTGRVTDSVTVRADSDGNAIALWEACTSPNCSSFAIWSNRYLDHKGWGTALVLDTTVYEGLANFAFEGSGDAVAVWDSPQLMASEFR